LPRPVVTEAAEELYARLGPWAAADTERGLATGEWRLLEMCEGIMGRLQDIREVVFDDIDEDHPGWSHVLDVDRAPEEWLGWMAQFAGVRLQQGLDEVTQRARIKSTDGFRRGSPGAIVGAAQQYLTGDKTVYLVERHGSPYRLTVTTVAGETPDVASVVAAIKAQKPAGIVMGHTITTEIDYNALRDTHADYDEVADLYVNYNEVLANPVKQ
jgi:hypothetical protein